MIKLSLVDLVKVSDVLIVSADAGGAGGSEISRSFAIVVGLNLNGTYAIDASGFAHCSEFPFLFEPQLIDVFDRRVIRGMTSILRLGTKSTLAPEISGPALDL